ncbi:Gluconolactonase precursor [Rubripirellula lacrimiformis]|uniref:Gluconolactonase n=1 Tax=Rubripirellula lacrimiformis TaxID=1930273 RepID=A0A517N9B5_9BACT|nr:SMP-30/gluconolactonase/LRE family protein [Rubripirellula lacrimiformis]QDT03724.1 Gluconolactonase precursor [Rubripirellula lacrimiformis]
MRFGCFFALVLVGVVSVADDSAATSDAGPPESHPIIADGVQLQLAGDGYSFTEGPTADADGNVYFTDQPNDRIVFFDFATRKASTWLQPAGRSNGLYFVAKDRMIACADAENQLWSFNLNDKSHKVLLENNNGQRFGGPNDCWADQDGSIYFTDPMYQRPYWNTPLPADHPRGVYRLSAGGELTQLLDNLVQPNGIIGDAERRRLYIADIGDKKTYSYRIAQDGSLIDRELYCTSGSDGMTIDINRRLYLTGSEGVTVYKDDGTLVETIAVPRKWTANVTFGGPENKHLFITAGDSVFTIETTTEGL